MLTKEAIEKYFMAEKAESGLFVAIGVAAIIAAIICFFAIKTPQYKGAAIPFLIVGILLSIVGFTVYKKSDGDRIRNVYAFTMNPSELKQIETPRMVTVMKKFVLYRYVEIALVVIGLALFFYCRNNQAQAYYKGLGIGLATMALIALTADYFAEKRGHIYLNLLHEFAAKK
jgi:ABC-type xylose transport system permease subunit